MSHQNRAGNVARVFHALARAQAEGIPMIPRSAGDKEYFAQDWFAGRLSALGIPFTQQGRNSYPDYLVGEPAQQEGYEIKSLAFANGRPARADLDFNSTIPSGLKGSTPVFLVFFLYQGRGAQERSVHTISVAHGDLLNCDHAVADEHLNVNIPRFGSYADGLIRNRKMYVFPHPVSLDPDALGRARLFVPSEWQLSDPKVRHIKVVERTVAIEAIDSYRIHLYGRGVPSILRDAYANAGERRRFDVFAPAL